MGEGLIETVCWVPLPLRAADSDKNGAVDVEDLLSVLKYYDRECKDHQRPAEGAGFFG